MERKLDPSVRILKVWKAWGDQQSDVALILRHYHHHHSTTDGYIDKRMSNKVFRRKSTQHHRLTNHVIIGTNIQSILQNYLSSFNISPGNGGMGLYTVCIMHNVEA